jgi:hypothetical protein
VFASQLSFIPEARLNLCIYYLNKGELTKAQETIKGLEPSKPEEYVLHAVVAAAVG